METWRHFSVGCSVSGHENDKANCWKFVVLRHEFKEKEPFNALGGELSNYPS